MSLCIKIILKVLFWIIVGGIGFNYIMRFISYSFYKRAIRNEMVDERIRRIEIGNSLFGYVSSKDFQEKKKVILYFGGSGEIAYNAVLTYGDLFNNYIFACVDYEGTQESKGKMNLKTMQESALKLYDYIIKEDYVDTSSIFVIGYSYGSGIATFLSSKRECEKLVLIAAFRDLCDLYNKILPVFYGPLRIFVSDNISTKTYASDVQGDVLLITSDGDRTINRKIPKALSGYFKNVCVKEFSGISHQDYWKNEDVVSCIHDFIF